MSTEMQTALVGVFGTLAGTFLGWMLNNLSQRGKLNFYVTSFEEGFQYNEEGRTVKSSSIEATELYYYILVMDVYNSSGAQRIMRNVTMEFRNRKKTLFESVPLDEDTAYEPSYSCRGGYMYDKIAPVNILPKTTIQLKLRGYIKKSDVNMELFKDAEKLCLSYTDEKNKRRKVLIKKEHYCDHFKQDKAEES